MIKHCVSFSGGIGSWAAAKRVADKYGPKNVVLLFADTLMEDEDLYRFLDQAAENIGSELIKISDGRNPWEIFHDERFLGNSRVDPCSKLLKRKLLDKWRNKNLDPDAGTMYIGIDWTEEHRLINLQKRCQPWTYEAPMCEAPYLSKAEMLEWAESEGLKRPRLYEMGFPHNNCGGFCIKAGQAQFALLLKTMPERYAFHEQKEQDLRAHLERDDITILRKQVNKQKINMTLKEFREGIEKQSTLGFDTEEWGGCGCAID